MSSRRFLNKNGFTLIELITAMIIGAIFGAIIFQFMGTALTGSTEPLLRLKKSQDLQRVMDSMILYFEDRKSRAPLDMAAFRTSIGNAGEDMDNDYGHYTVVENETIKFDGASSESDDGLGTGMDDVLKVTIKNDSGQTATALFVN